MTPLLEGWPTKAKEAPSPREVRVALLDTNSVFQCLWVKLLNAESRAHISANGKFSLKLLTGFCMSATLTLNGLIFITYFPLTTLSSRNSSMFYSEYQEVILTDVRTVQILTSDLT